MNRKWEGRGHRVLWFNIASQKGALDDIPLCSYCNTPARGERKLQKCSRYKQAQYHDKECQKRHYKEHKITCRQSEAPVRQPAAASSDTQPTTSFGFGDGNTPFVGIDVIDAGGELGRVAIAKQAFSAGDVVSSESSAIVFNYDISELLMKFLDAPMQTQESILDLYHGSDSDDEFGEAERGYFDAFCLLSSARIELLQ